MHIEDQINELTQTVAELTDKVAHLEQVNNDKWVSAKELSEVMRCSVNNIYIKIRSGEIYASKKLGSPRIPLSQFYEDTITPEPEKPKKQLSLKERVFEN